MRRALHRLPLLALAAVLAALALPLREIAPLVAESGIRAPEDVRRCRAQGAAMLLVGEALSSAPDAESATRALVRA